MSRITHAVLEVRSQDKKPNETSTNFTWTSKKNIEFKEMVNGSGGRRWIYSVRPENILIPNTMYSVNDTNNTLSVTETGGSGGGGSYTVTFDNGNYSMTDFITELTSELTTASVAEDVNTFSAVHDPTSGKLIISYTGSSTSVQFNDSGSTSFGIIGLNTGSDHSFTVAAPLEAQKVSFLNKIRFVTLHASGGISLNNFFDVTGNSNKIARVPMLADEFTDNFIPNDRGSNFFRITPTQAIKSFQFQLRDESGELVDLNGEDFHFDLVFYKRMSF